ncbi:MAG TPA: hypothetical protein VMH20_01145 [Verrucomicrobiae bacterium]|nr:hypothetical protein [Verrucomicrobiae bacterium]
MKSDACFLPTWTSELKQLISPLYGYAWDFESALKDPAQPSGGPSYSDKGVGTCHGGHNWGDNNQDQNN